MNRGQQALAALSRMAPPIEGACLCGAVEYVCSASPVWSAHCHCRACQQLSGAPFASAFCVPIQAFKISGETIAFRRTADSGRTVATHHCARCGTRMYAGPEETKLAAIFASTLRDSSQFVAIANVYASCVAPWISLPQAFFDVPEMPPPYVGPEDARGRLGSAP